VLYYIFNTLLISLFVLHIYWWILIFRMIVKQVEARGRVSDDVRSGTNVPLDSTASHSCLLINYKSYHRDWYLSSLHYIA